MINKDNIDNNIECLILEDEYYTALEIKRLLIAYKPGYRVAAILETCMEFDEFISRNVNVDLIVGNIYLADGFTPKYIMQSGISVPVILTRGADGSCDYNLPNLIGYISKPVTKELLYSCINKFESEYILHPHTIGCN